MSSAKPKAYYFIPTLLEVHEKKSAKNATIKLQLKTVVHCTITETGASGQLVYADEHCRLFTCDLTPAPKEANVSQKHGVKRFSRMYNQFKLRQEMKFRSSEESHGVSIKKATYKLPSHVEWNKQQYQLSKYEPTCQKGGIGWYVNQSKPNSKGMVFKTNTTEEGQHWKGLMSSVINKHLLPLELSFRAGAGKGDKRWYVMGMQECDMDLWDYIVKEGYKPCMSEALKISRGIAGALAAISRSEYKTHGDVKPENIFVSINKDKKTTQYWLGDFDTCEVGGSQAVLGTVEYFAPSRPATGVINQKDDVFAFGLVMLCLLTGEIYPTPEYLALDPHGKQALLSKVVSRLSSDSKLSGLLLGVLNPNAAERLNWGNVIEKLEALIANPPKKSLFSSSTRLMTKKTTQFTQHKSRRISAIQRTSRSNAPRKSLMHSVIIE